MTDDHVILHSHRDFKQTSSRLYFDQHDNIQLLDKKRNDSDLKIHCLLALRAFYRLDVSVYVCVCTARERKAPPSTALSCRRCCPTAHDRSDNAHPPGLKLDRRALLFDFGLSLVSTDINPVFFHSSYSSSQ